MPDHEDTSLLIGELSSLARDKLKTQSGRSVALDAGALGLMLLDAALVATVIETEGAYELGIAALALLGLSFGLAIRALRHKGATETGPSVARLSEERETHAARQIRESMRAELIDDAQANDRALARKTVLFDRALIVMAFAILIDLAGSL
jgi:glucose-6-phosphate-specific signal transduction histidine kinase